MDRNSSTGRTGNRIPKWGFESLFLSSLLVSFPVWGEAVQLNGAPIVIGAVGEVRYQQVGTDILWFSKDGKVFLTINNCANATFHKKDGVWYYACN